MRNPTPTPWDRALSHISHTHKACIKCSSQDGRLVDREGEREADVQRGIPLGGPTTGDCRLQWLAKMWQPTSKETNTDKVKISAQFTLSQSTNACLPLYLDNSSGDHYDVIYFECSVIIDGLRWNIFVAVLNWHLTELRDTHLLWFPLNDWNRVNLANIRSMTISVSERCSQGKTCWERVIFGWEGKIWLDKIFSGGIITDTPDFTRGVTVG